MIRPIILPLRLPRGFVTTFLVPFGGGVTFHILTESGLVIDTELTDQMRTE